MFGTIKVGRGTPISRSHGPKRRSRLALFPLLACLLLPALSSAQVGINAHIPSPDMLDLVAESGATWIRVDANWDLLQPERGRYAYAVLDGPIANATSRGLSVYASLGYTPAWVPKVPRERTDTYGGNDEPATSEEWVAFVENAVTHFRGMGVTHFGMWNEPNLEHFWDGDIDSYVEKILIPGSDAVHRVCGDCVVLGADLAHVGEVDDALDRVLALVSYAIGAFTHHLSTHWPAPGHSALAGAPSQTHRDSLVLSRRTVECTSRRTTQGRNPQLLLAKDEGRAAARLALQGRIQFLGLSLAVNSGAMFATGCYAVPLTPGL